MIVAGQMLGTELKDAWAQTHGADKTPTEAEMHDLIIQNLTIMDLTEEIKSNIQAAYAAARPAAGDENGL